MREDDTLHIHSIDRLARNLIELQSIVQNLNNRGINIHFHTEDMIFTSSKNNKQQPMQVNIFQALTVFAQFERSLIKERQLEGIAKAKKEGRQLGRPRKISQEDRIDIIEKLKQGIPPKMIAQEYNIDVSSVYKVKLN